ncbi:MAG: hypothetical protein HUU22_02345 [Phycisphaerae bacterium]|nr:hypothetical protein [Phycisphaerae bacterium]
MARACGPRTTNGDIEQNRCIREGRHSYMGLFDWLTNRRTPLSKMTRSELRRQELLLEKERGRLLKRVEDLAKSKHEIFEKGAIEKTPEVRRILAQEFELKTTEQLMLARQLNIRSKELLTVTRLRMLRENMERAKQSGSKLGLVGERDLIALERMIENDTITAEMYQDRLDAILTMGQEAPEGALTEAGQHVLDMWERLDTGAVKDPAQAFQEADRRVRERHKASAEGA